MLERHPLQVSLLNIFLDHFEEEKTLPSEDNLFYSALYVVSYCAANTFVFIYFSMTLSMLRFFHDIDSKAYFFLNWLYYQTTLTSGIVAVWRKHLKRSLKFTACEIDMCTLSLCRKCCLCPFYVSWHSTVSFSRRPSCRRSSFPIEDEKRKYCWTLLNFQNSDSVFPVSENRSPQSAQIQNDRKQLPISEFLHFAVSPRFRIFSPFAPKWIS